MTGKTGRVLVLLTCLAAFGPAPSSAWSEQPASQPAPASRPATAPADALKVATYNVLYLNQDLKAVADSIRQSRADVVCLQETNAESERFLRAQLRAAYPRMLFRHAPAAGGLAVLSKLPLRNVRVLPPRFGWFATYLCQVQLGGQTVQIANVHLTATNPPPDYSAEMVLRLWLRTEDIRRQEIAHLCGSLPEDAPTIIAGDLNSLPGWSAPRYLKRQGFIDGLAAARPDAADVVTWTSSLRGVKLALRLDYIFHSRHLRTTEAHVIASDASDHHLLVQTLALAPAATSRSASGPAASSRPSPAAAVTDAP